MTLQLINPDGVFKPDTYVQVGVGQGSSIVCLSGQVALDADGELIGHGDVAAQAEQVFSIIFHALAGAPKADRELGFDIRKPSTLIGVTSLASPDFLPEVEAMALRAR